MHYQFVHIETYSKKAIRVQGELNQVNTGEQIFGEAMRLPHYARHVPHSPEVQELGGTMTIIVLYALWKKKISEIRVLAKSKTGMVYERGLKSDARTIYTEVHSHPLTCVEYYNDYSIDRKPEIDKWRDLVSADFRRRMPPDIDYSVVMHLDERYVHLHIIALNTPDPRLDANKLHVGKKAGVDLRNGGDAISRAEPLPSPILSPMPRKPKRQKTSKYPKTQSANDALYARQIEDWTFLSRLAKEENGVIKAQWKIDNRLHLSALRDRQGPIREHHVYKTAMREFQDSYFQHVGQLCGLLRSGPNLKRKTTMQSAVEKQHKKQLADALKEMTDAEQENIVGRREKAAAELRNLRHQVNANRLASEAKIEKQACALRDVATARDARLTSAYEALAREMAEGTLFREEDGMIGARDIAAIMRGSPEIDPALESVMKTIDALEHRKAAVVAVEKDLALREAAIEHAEADANKAVARQREAEAETRKLNDQADTARLAVKHAVKAKTDAEIEASAIIKANAARVERLTSASAVLAREIEEGTLFRQENGNIGARDMAAIIRGRPEIDPAVVSAMKIIDALEQRRAEVAAEKANLELRQTTVALAEKEVTRKLSKISEGIASLKRMRAIFDGYVAKLDGLLRLPDLPKAALDVALDLNVEGQGMQTDRLQLEEDFRQMLEFANNRGADNTDLSDPEPPREEDSGPGL